MSTTSALSAGVQQIYNAGLLPSSLSTSTLNGATSGQINKMVASTIASEQVSALLGTGSSSSADSASLSSTAENALLQEINPTSTSSTSSSSTTDPLTAAVDNALTSSLNAAVSQFASPTASTTGTNVNAVG